MHLEKGNRSFNLQRFGLIRKKKKLTVGIKMCKSVLNTLRFWIVLFFDIPDFHHYLEENSRALPDPALVEH